MSPAFSSAVEIRAGVFYDSRTLGAADKKISDLFAKPNSAATEPLGYFHNLDVTGGLIPAGEEAVVDGVAFSTDPDITVVNLVKFLKGVLIITRNKRESLTIPIKFVPSMGGVFGFSNQALATGGADFPSSGVPSAQNYLPLDPAVEVIGGQQFSVSCEWGTAPGALFFHVLLRAAHKRPGLA
jgi:hypothetical protein